MNLYIKKVKDVKFDDELYVLYKPGEFDEPICIMGKLELERLKEEIEYNTRFAENK